MIERPRARFLPARVPGLLLGLAVALSACGEEPREIVPDVAPRAPAPRLPDALMVRFQEVKGEGFSRESWEIEVLQMGGDVRLRGAIRTGGTSVPILDVMTTQDYVEFWDWLKTFPLDKARPAEDPAAPKAEWRKTLSVDVVLDEETRWKSRTVWTRPLQNAPWVASIEQRLHDLALKLANREVERQEREAATGGSGADDGAGGAAAAPGAIDGLPDGN